MLEIKDGSGKTLFNINDDGSTTIFDKKTKKMLEDQGVVMDNSNIIDKVEE